jgi:hypothetical protein
MVGPSRRHDVKRRRHKRLHAPGTILIRGLRPRTPYTRSRSALRRLAPLAWLTRSRSFAAAFEGAAPPDPLHALSLGAATPRSARVARFAFARARTQGRKFNPAPATILFEGLRPGLPTRFRFGAERYGETAPDPWRRRALARRCDASLLPPPKLRRDRADAPVTRRRAVLRQEGRSDSASASRSTHATFFDRVLTTIRTPTPRRASVSMSESMLKRSMRPRSRSL